MKKTVCYKILPISDPEIEDIEDLKKKSKISHSTLPLVYELKITEKKNFISIAEIDSELERINSFVCYIHSTQLYILIILKLIISPTLIL